MVSWFRPADEVRDGGASVMSQTLPSEVLIFMVPCGPASFTPSVTTPLMAVTSWTFPPQPGWAKAGMVDAIEMAAVSAILFRCMTYSQVAPANYAAFRGLWGG